MNADRGKEYNKCISDYILKLNVLIDGESVELRKEDCEFSYCGKNHKESRKIA